MIPEVKFVKKPWGFEYWFVNTALYCGKLICCKDNIWSSGGRYHHHRVKDETFFVIRGQLELDINGNIHDLKYLSNYRILPMRSHRFRNKGNRPCLFIEVSTHHNDEDSVREAGGLK